jgi:transcriptional regulator with XRE-family HTH domain
MGSRSTTTVDSHVGRRVRERRVALGLSGDQFAKIIGVTYQQAYKYERGADRMSAGRLYEIACALGAPITYFFEELDGRPRPIASEQRRLLEITRNIAEIEDVRFQQAIGQLVRALADP